MTESPLGANAKYVSINRSISRFIIEDDIAEVTKGNASLLQVVGACMRRKTGIMRLSCKPFFLSSRDNLPSRMRQAALS